MQVNKTNSSLAFSSKVNVSHNTLGAISLSKNGFARQVKQIRALENNGVDDVVEIFSCWTDRINKDGCHDTDAIMNISVIKKVDSKIFRGCALASYITKELESDFQYKQTAYEKKWDFFTPDILKLYEEAKNNMEEIIVIPSLQKYI